MKPIDKEGILKKARQAWLFFLDLIFPIECQICGAPETWLCPACRGSIKAKKFQYCLACKKRNLFGQFCPACRQDYFLAGVWLATDYDSLALAKIIKNYKYNLIKDLDKVLARFLILFCQESLDNFNLIKQAKNSHNFFNYSPLKLPNILFNFSQIIVMPVPLSKKRLRWRGFNQSELLATEFAKHFSLNLNSSDLIRSRHTKPQTKLKEIERKENVKNCFAVVGNGGDLKNKIILLIDDVVTTGSTLNECAKVLKQAGAREVWGLAVAKG